MASDITPSATDTTSVIASATLSRGSTNRGTIDLRTKWGGRLFLKCGHGGTTALTNGVDVLMRALHNNGGVNNPTATPPLRSTPTASNSTTVNTDSSSGQAALNVASITGFAAGDIIIIGGTTAREEYARVSKTATGVLTLDANLKNTHTAAQADTVRNKADAWTVEIPGWSLWEVIFDYGDDSAGESVQIEALAQTFDKVSAT
jgi:hypothetical protein